MTIIELKTYFNLSISENIYPSTEIGSFFQILINFKLGLTKIDVALNPNLEITNSDVSFFKDSIKKLNKQTPIQYITGETEFYGLKLKVNKNVLIPRPETEELVDWILKDYKNQSNLNILDVGTGSGCIPIALSKNLKKATIHAYDISTKALKLAEKNAQFNDAKISFKKVNILTTDVLDNKFDVIVSNPPYVQELEKDKIKNNVLQYEPHLALFVKNEDPLLFYKKIAKLAKISLKENGRLYFEINQYLGLETKISLQNIGFKNIELRKDIYGNDRMIRAEI